MDSEAGTTRITCTYTRTVCTPCICTCIYIVYSICVSCICICTCTFTCTMHMYRRNMQRDRGHTCTCTYIQMHDAITSSHAFPSLPPHTLHVFPSSSSSLPPLHFLPLSLLLYVYSSSFLLNQCRNERDSEVLPLHNPVMKDLEPSQSAKRIDHVQEPPL